ncbi:hypothetical protein [Blautia obeum]|uniref:Uncharacterized protein n=1 Tax=Blautia obeum TaxID=40520 RepID=A0A564SBF9_9FIRM|nr:hypothetical protein [Blautia obeum]VUW92113.1 Uncharacterised protein [Blautia obeum]
MEELYKVMDDLLDLEFQIKAGMDILKELEELYTSDPEKEETEAEKMAVLTRGYLQSMKVNLREIIHYIDESTLEKAKSAKDQKQESPSKVSKDVKESVDKIIANRMSKSYSEWKSNQDTPSFNENIEKEYQKLLETLSPEQEEVLTKYCDAIFASGAETEEFFYRLGIKDGLRLKSTVKSVLEMMS